LIEKFANTADSQRHEFANFISDYLARCDQFALPSVSLYDQGIFYTRNDGRIWAISRIAERAALGAYFKKFRDTLRPVLSLPSGNSKENSKKT